MAFFPMFTDLRDKECLVVGGGTIALQKVRILSDFDARITVIAKRIDESIAELSKEADNINIMQKAFEPDDINNMSLVVAATDDKNINHRISVLCKGAGIPVNAVDQKDDCTFIFPAYVREKDIVVAVSSGGNSPLMTREIKKKVKDVLNPVLGEINEGLGDCREYVKSQVHDDIKRKIIFRRIYEESVKADQMISKDRIQEIITDGL